MGDLRAAIGLLTRLPVGGGSANLDPVRGIGWFPAVGLIVAATGIAVRVGLEPLLGAAASIAAAVVAAIVVAGAFHEDGLADFADGVWGGATPQRRLEIMRDSQLGTYGTLAVISDFVLRITLLGSVGLDGFIRALVAGEVLGRLAPALLAAWLPPARRDGQAAALQPARLAGWTVAGATTLIVAVAAGGIWSPALLAAAGAAVWVMGRIARAKLGGTTGDVHGGASCASRRVVMATAVGFAQSGAW